MTIEIKKFGTILISRPAGKEAFAAAKAYLLPQNSSEKEFSLDFAGVDVLSPSWADEFIAGLKNTFNNPKLIFLNTQNPSVRETLAILSTSN